MLCSILSNSYGAYMMYIYYNIMFNILLNNTLIIIIYKKNKTKYVRCLDL